MPPPLPPVLSQWTEDGVAGRPGRRASSQTPVTPACVATGCVTRRAQPVEEPSVLVLGQRYGY